MENTRYVSSLKDVHIGSDIWVLGSGASMNYVEPSFFENKITIGLNTVGVRYKTNYTMLKDLVRNGAKGVRNCKSPPFNSDYVIASEWDKGGLGNRLNTDPSLNKIYAKYPDKFYFFKHIKNGFGNTSVIHKNSDKFFISTSTMASSVHMAAYMGAANIMICGHDLLALDGKMYFDGYKRSSPGMQKFWIKRNIHNDTMVVRDIVKKVYGCNTHTLNPFIGFDLEGHAYGEL